MQHTKYILQECYSNQAQHFGRTRNKYWPEIEYINKVITQYINSNEGYISILDLGCGMGRKQMFEHLVHNHNNKSRKYVGVDYAKYMIQCAKDEYKNYKNISFVHHDMLSFLKQSKNESFDIILGICSLQHIKNNYERCLILHHIYRTLKRKGYMILINRSYSLRFLKKYWKNQIHSLMQYLCPRKQRARNDIFIPRKSPSNKKKRMRYYHIFTHQELKNIVQESGFLVHTLFYSSSQQDTNISKRRKSRNTVLLAEKTYAYTDSVHTTTGFARPKNTRKKQKMK